MNYTELVQSAQMLQRAEEPAVKEYHLHFDFLVAAINKYMLTRSDLNELIGKNNISMMKNNHFNHVMFIHSILKYPNAEVLVDTIIWVFRTYRSHGFSTKYWHVQLEGWMNILPTQISHATYEQILPLYKWMLAHIESFRTLSENSSEEKKFA